MSGGVPVGADGEFTVADGGGWGFFGYTGGGEGEHGGGTGLRDPTHHHRLS